MMNDIFPNLYIHNIKQFLRRFSGSSLDIFRISEYETDL
jgi:hypothetical protein